MAEAWKRTNPDGLTYGKVLQHIIDADRQISGGKYRQTIVDCFNWREIIASTTSLNEQSWMEPHIIEELTFDPLNEEVTHH
ncbi:hypothetical protein JDS79_30630 [Bacillus cereus]|nr:hypothetical protein [Bacillus cereus]